MAEVYFADLRARRRQDSLAAKVRRLVERAGISQVVAEKDLVAVKVHFGERGGDAYVSPVFVRQVVDAVKAQGGKPFVTDTNTLYSGSRANSVDHLTTAVEHGFDFAVLGCPVIIADGLRSGSVVDLPGVGKIFSKVHAAADLVASDALVVLSHFKGHEMAGFGGAVKNLAMGCAPAAGKRDQHALRATVHREKCVGCGECVEVCPVHAINLAEGRALIDRGVCIGCGECMTVCPQRAIDTSNPEDLRDFAERLAEYATALAAPRREKTLFVNFVLRVTPDCDCVPWSDAALVPDQGILASRDPVALDQACFDLVRQAPALPGTLLECACPPGEDKFSALWPQTCGLRQLEYAEELGLGSRAYALIPLD
ncbi:MAG TPA: DUF362 domain-containing protein [Synergistaceae bacterium]|nr:DUF362 domain-containing protein [Synergistaceae bacterium]HQH79213.1 DUF362 domain-containing protein [Synergistaceae bacterium]